MIGLIVDRRLGTGLAKQMLTVGGHSRLFQYVLADGTVNVKQSEVSHVVRLGDAFLREAHEE